VAFSIAAKWSVGAFDHTAEIISPAISFHRSGLFSRLGAAALHKAYPEIEVSARLASAV